ncbi:hypothetical protein [Halococcus salsus]|uniref:hypothetical protein n=1 Tax=Halococcus salsus TaxID=2162894 RepID=UPI0013579250|nr:hypothetical protein [Halococcus salsus]
MSTFCEERAVLLADGEYLPECAIAAVAVQESISTERLPTPVVRFSDETDDVEVVVRRRD